MKIIKYKRLSSGKYKVFLDNNETIILHENIIIKYNLLLTKSLDNIDEIIKDNNDYMIYDDTLKYISKKMRCSKEIKDYLLKREINEKEINNVINKLKDNNLINDRMYAKSYISDKIRLNKYGPNKIKNELLKLKIDNNIIEEELMNIDNENVEDNLSNIIDKKIKLNKSYSGNVLKNKILNELVNMGYKREDIINHLENKDLTNEELYQKEYDKLYNKYSKKYSDSELEYYINQKLYQKGFKKNND